jgi:hypothetical protein
MHASCYCSKHLKSQVSIECFASIVTHTSEMAMGVGWLTSKFSQKSLVKYINRMMKSNIKASDQCRRAAGIQCLHDVVIWCYRMAICLNLEHLRRRKSGTTKSSIFRNSFLFARTKENGAFYQKIKLCRISVGAAM